MTHRTRLILSRQADSAHPFPVTIEARPCDRVSVVGGSNSEEFVIKAFVPSDRPLSNTDIDFIRQAVNMFEREHGY